MGNFGNKWNKFVQIFIEKNGYVKVVQGLQNTLLIAVVGMLIGVLIGTIIATVRVLPKYKTLPRALNAVCSFYVGLFRGTPMVVQLLIFYYVMLPLMGIKLPGVRVAMVVFGLNSEASFGSVRPTVRRTTLPSYGHTLTGPCPPRPTTARTSSG